MGAADLPSPVPPKRPTRRVARIALPLLVPLVCILLAALVIRGPWAALITAAESGSSSQHCLWDFTFIAWQDLNEDGSQDSGEPSLAGAIIDARPDFMPFAEEWGTTNDNGRLEISDVYTLCDTTWHFIGTPPPSYVRTTPRIIEATRSGTYYFGFNPTEGP